MNAFDSDGLLEICSPGNISNVIAYSCCYNQEVKKAGTLTVFKLRTGFRPVSQLIYAVCKFYQIGLKGLN